MRLPAVEVPLKPRPMRSARWRAIHFVTILAFVLATVFAPLLAAARSPKRGGPGYLQVLSVTIGADIYVDGNKVGTVPFEDYISLAAGDHLVELRRRGYSDASQTVRVRAGETQDVIIDLIAVDGVLSVVTPGIVDAAVSVDGEIIGFTPFDGLVPAGEHMVEVAANGYRTFSQKLSVRAGEVYELAVELKPDGRSDVATPATATALATSVEERDDGDTPVHKTWWFWTLLGVGVAAVGAGTAAAVIYAKDGGGTEVRRPDWAVTVPR